MEWNETTRRKVSPDVLRMADEKGSDATVPCLLVFKARYGAEGEFGGADTLLDGIEEGLRERIGEALEQERFPMEGMPVCIALDLTAGQIEHAAATDSLERLEHNATLQSEEQPEEEAPEEEEAGEGDGEEKQSGETIITGEPDGSTH